MSARKPKAEPGPEVTLPITPMLDMAFQLLAFFIFIYHPSDLEGQMQMALPSSDVKMAHQEQDVDPSAAPDRDPTTEVEADLAVIIKAEDVGDRRGTIRPPLTLEDRAGGNMVRDLEDLADQLKKARSAAGDSRSDAKGAIKIQADGGLKWDELVKVMDVCRQAGFDNISFAPPPGFEPGN
jgi:biopolymer transport protein ExbD